MPGPPGVRRDAKKIYERKDYFEVADTVNIPTGGSQTVSVGSGDGTSPGEVTSMNVPFSEISKPILLALLTLLAVVLCFLLQVGLSI